MTWLLRVVLAILLALTLSYAVLHSVTLTTLPANAQEEVPSITPGELRGRITAEEGGEPIANVEVIAVPVGDPGKNAYAYSDHTGTYTLTLRHYVEGEDYKVYFDPPNTSPYALEFYPHKRTFAEGEIVAIPNEAVVRLDVTLLPGATIRGTVTSSWYDKPIDLPDVKLLDEHGRRVTSNSYAWGEEEPPGTYALYNVPAGSYQFLFWANLHYNLESKTLVTVAPGATVTGPHAHMIYYVGNVLSIATSPAFPNAIALALDRQPEPLVSLNGGRTWQYLPVSPWIADEDRFAYPDRLPEGGIVTALAPRGAPSDGIRFIVGTAIEPSENSDSPVFARGLYRSADGQSWSEATIETQVDESKCDDGRFSPPVVTPAEPKNLYVFYKCVIDSSQQLYVSHDAGITWQDRTTHEGETIALNRLARLVVSPIVKDEIYLYDGEDQWYWSTDSGLTWVTKTLPVDSFIFDGEEPNYLYGWGLYGPHLDRTGKRSRDGGATWEDWPQQPCGSYADPPLIFAPTGYSRTFFLECGVLYRTDNGGDNWRTLSTKSGRSGRMLVLDYGTPGGLLWAEDGGLWASNDLGESWRRILTEYQPVTTIPLYLPSLKGKQ